jgi:pimeloyl-ACP methyl ester carboxylesterase
MAFIETRDGTRLFFRDWGKGAPVVLVASQAVSCDVWNYNVPALIESDMRCVSFDRRGHGRSDQPGGGYDIDTLAEDLGSVLRQLDLRDVTLVGHSLGGGEIIRYLGRHDHEGRVRRAVLIAPTAPFLTKTPDNPGGIDASAFDAVRAQWRIDFPRWVSDGARPFFAPETSEALLRWGERLIADMPLHVLLQVSNCSMNCDLRADLRAIAVPTLVLHGDLDASVPVAFGKATADMIRSARFVHYERAAHGVFVTHAAQVNRDIVDFVRGS